MKATEQGLKLIHENALSAGPQTARIFNTFLKMVLYYERDFGFVKVAVIEGKQPKYLTPDKYAQALNPKFKKFDDLTNQLFEDFTFEDIIGLAISFWLGLPPIENYKTLKELINEQLKEKYFSLAIARTWSGKTQKITPSDRYDYTIQKAYKQYDLYLQFGQLTFEESPQLQIEFDQKKISRGLDYFDRRFFDYCIINMRTDGTISLNHKAILNGMGKTSGGVNWNRLANSIKSLASVKYYPTIKLPGYFENNDDNEFSLIYPSEPLLKIPEIIEKKNGKIKKRGFYPVATLPSVIVQMKSAGNFLVRRDYKKLKGLNDEQYALMIILHEHFRMNITKPEWAINLKSFIDLANWTVTTTQEKRSIIKLNRELDALIKFNQLKSYDITRAKTKRPLKKAWWNQLKNIHLSTKDKNGKPSTNFKAFENIIYHFIPTDEFKKEHINVIEKRLKGKLSAEI